MQNQLALKVSHCYQQVFASVTAVSDIFTVVTASEARSSSAMVPSVISEEVIVVAVAKDAKPRLVLAAAAVVAPVPPFANWNVASYVSRVCSCCCITS